MHFTGRSGTVRGSGSWYEVDLAPGVRAVLASTSESRHLLVSPDLVGRNFRRAVALSATNALGIVKALSPVVSQTVRTRGASVVTVLRGGLSFAVERAVTSLWNVEPAVSFLGTERAAQGDVHLVYARWALVPDSVLFVGDIVATGRTLVALLDAAITESQLQQTRLRAVVVITIAAAAGLRQLAAALAVLRREGFVEEVWVVALEAVFRLPDRKLVPSQLRLSPLDFLRSSQASTPEFEGYRLSVPAALLERCAIYDGGERAFNPGQHRHQRLAWWNQVAADPTVSMGVMAADLAGLAEYGHGFQEWEAMYPQSPTRWAPGGGRRLHLQGQVALSRSSRLGVREFASYFVLHGR